MINNPKWINTLTKTKEVSGNSWRCLSYKLDHDVWINTIPKEKKIYSSVKAYSLTAILFVCGLIFVSIIKNETRSLQKEINNIEASMNSIKFDLNQSILDNEVITSPENISHLASEYLNFDLASYKRSQIVKLDDDKNSLSLVNKLEKIKKQEKVYFSIDMRKKVAKKVEAKKKEIKKIKELYNKPETIPDEIKTRVASKIDETKTQLKNMYNSPGDQISLKKAGKWGAIQVVKAFLGMPIIPGR